MKYKRIVIKISGRAIAGPDEIGFSSTALHHLASEVIKVSELGVQVALVVGGGNLFRGNRSEEWGIDRVEADNIGMMSTVINSLLLRGTLYACGGHNIRVMSAVPINAIVEPYIRLRAIHHLEKGATVIFACGNGQPFLTTDYPSVQRAIEVRADALLVAKHGVNGVYEKDPKINPGARRYESITYKDILSQQLMVMEQSAFILARDHNVPLHVFDVEDRGVMRAICAGERRGTLISTDVQHAKFY